MNGTLNKVPSVLETLLILHINFTILHLLQKAGSTVDLNTSPILEIRSEIF